MNIFIVFEIKLWPFNVGKDFALGHYLFGAYKLTKDTDSEKCKYSGYGIGFDTHGIFLLSDGIWFAKNVIKFGANMSSSVSIINKKKDILILCKVPNDGLDDTTLTAEKEYSVNFTEQQKKFCLSLH